MRKRQISGALTFTPGFGSAVVCHKVTHIEFSSADLTAIHPILRQMLRHAAGDKENDREIRTVTF